MIQVLRVRVIVAILATMLLIAIAASPALSHVTGFGGVVYADECIGASC